MTSDLTARDLTRLPDLIQGTGLTGPSRVRRPAYVDLLPPCNAACPAGENIQAWLAAARDGDYERAWRLLAEDNPFPAIHGRVCYHPCEDACNRAELDSPVSVHAVERFLGDWAIEHHAAHRLITATSGNAAGDGGSAGKRVLIIGAGPSGLSAAYHLARRGHEVEIRDAGPEPGGMMRYGIPAYRLPRDVLAAEIQRIEEMGVTITRGHAVTDLRTEMAGFDAAFVAVGAHLPVHTEIPAREASRIIDAVPFLRQVAEGGRPSIGRRVAVYGGGDTAMDAARTARRLGAGDALLVYRRTRDRMPAHEDEARAAEREGVTIHWLRTITAFDGPEMTVEVMELDDSGYPRPTGRTETLSADTVILALGQDADTAFLANVDGIEFGQDGTVRVGPDMMTGCPGVFAGGDMVPAERTVTVGTGHGKKAARHIDAYLRGERRERPTKHRQADYALLNPWYFSDAVRSRQPERPAHARTEGFSEVTGGLTEQNVRYEAARCLSCGNCFECDGCAGACPEDAVIKLGPGRRYQFDYDRCTGCGACYEQCPVHAIEMEQET